jgi:hypothetical protein
MRGRKSALIILLSDQERNELQRWSRSTSLSAGLVQRAKAVLHVSQGMPLKHTGTAVGLTERHIRKWITRFKEQRLPGLKDKEGRGRKPSFPPGGDDPCHQDCL